MTLTDLIAIFTSTGLPVTYYQWNEHQVPALPYLVFYFPSARPEAADNATQAGITSVNLELYTAQKDFETEQMVDRTLMAGGLVFSKSEAWIDSESMYEVLYQMEEIIDGQN